ncbi:DNA repair protein RecO [Candidatus Saccharibacteria bacterium]|nr:DNA repair protein RecO [Candidatus Saccharibacteria bacterium]
MKNYSATGLVLRRHNLGEADRILTIFTREKGKIKVVAKGVRRGKAKLAGHLEPFCEIELRFVKGRNLDLVIGAEATHIFRLPMQIEDTLVTSYTILEILSKMLPEEQPNETAYDLLVEVLTILCEDINPHLVTQYFSLKFLQTIGSQPDLDDTVPGSRHYLAYDSGQVLPQRPHEHYGIISDETIKLWRLIYTNPLNQIARINEVNDVLLEGENLLTQYYQYHFNLKFVSPKVFQAK